MLFMPPMWNLEQAVYAAQYVATLPATWQAYAATFKGQAWNLDFGIENG